MGYMFLGMLGYSIYALVRLAISKCKKAFRHK